MTKTTDSPALKGLANDIAAKRTEVNAKYDVVLADGYQPTEAEREEIKTLNKTIEELETKYAERFEMETGRKANEDRVAELKTPRRPGAYGGGETGESGIKTISDEVLSDQEFKSWVDENARRGKGPEGKFESPRAELKGLLTGSSRTSAGALIRREYDDTVLLPTRPLTIRDIITVGNTGVDLVEYAKQTVRENNAAAVAEATSAAGGSGAKPESALAYDQAQAIVKTIATWIPATRRALADVGQLRTLIDTDLRYMVAERLETEIVAGDGTGEHFLGLLNTGGMTVQAYDGDKASTLRKARTKCKFTGRAVPNAVLMNPIDWEALDLSKDGEGRYYWGGPTVLGNPRVWGVPVVEHEDMPVGRSILGDFRVATLWDREAAQVYSSDSHADFFVRNLIALLAELRAAFGVKRPPALVDTALA